MPMDRLFVFGSMVRSWSLLIKKAGTREGPAFLRRYAA